MSLHPDARPVRRGSLATPTQFGYTGQVTDNVDGIVLDYELQAGCHRMLHASPPPSRG